MRQEKFFLVHMVGGFPKPKIGISLVGLMVILFHIQTKPANALTIQMGLGLHIVIKLPEDALLAMIRMHIQTLKPPKIPVSPVAPLKGHQYLSNHDALVTIKPFFCNRIPSLMGILQERFHTQLQYPDIQISIFSFTC